MKILIPLLCTTLAALGLVAWFMWPLEMLGLLALFIGAIAVAWTGGKAMRMGGEM